MKKRFIFVPVAAAIAVCAGWYLSQYGFQIADEVTFPWGYTVQIPDEISFPWGYTVRLKGSEADDSVSAYVESVADITGAGSVGVINRYTGSVETQETTAVNFDSTKKLSELFVKEGDEVKVGDPLFSYDTDDINLQLQEYDLEIEEMGYELQSLEEQLTQLQTAAAKAKESELPSYNIQILSAQNSIRKQNYDISVKQLERSNLEKSLDNAVVTSTAEGIIKKIDASKASGGTSSYSDSASSDGGYITILATGNFRIKGTASEMSVQSLYTGEAVLVRPRADEAKVYHGTITKVESEPATDTSSNSYYYSDTSSESASKYHFYVELDEEMDLMLGQHVLIEPDEGQTEEKEGLWLPMYYIAEDEEGSYVWKADSRERLEKSYLTIGETDEDLQECEILGGLAAEDYIAFPDASFTEGIPVIMP